MCDWQHKNLPKMHQQVVYKAIQYNLISLYILEAHFYDFITNDILDYEKHGTYQPLLFNSELQLI